MVVGVRTVTRIVRGRPGALAVRRAALAAVVADVLIVITGGVVRLTGSGLGCTQWPNCTSGSLLPTETPGYDPVHRWIEFGNRLVTFVVVIAAIVALLLVLRQRPRRSAGILAPAFGAVGLIVIQAVVGGVSVLYDLDWGWVAIHFLLSMALLLVAFALYVRAGESDRTPQPLVRRELRWATWLLVGVAAATLVAGTLVTATGPHAGDKNTGRLGLDPRNMTQLHADLVFLLVGLTVALWLGVKAADAPRSLVRAVTSLFAVEMAQGVVGYVQYFTYVPPVLVGFHMFGACLVWLAALHVALATRERPANRDDHAERGYPAAESLHVSA